ncbi:MAG TPA: PilC/PilY family type IV pilus protein [Caldimonas sp.]|nr:PilC/PilY family type IV pilus protein [Caldimonas sp.]
MNIVEPLLAPRRLGARGVAALLAMALTSISHGGQTDIAATPLASTTAALVKPNIMLLMDASGSMARTHMPDEVETLMGATSVGYKSSQCNSLYYDPAQKYPRPKMYDGSLFPAQPFSAARYAGFGSFHAVADLRVTNLNSEFVAYDAATLEVPSPFPDTPQAAYYYVYTGPETLSFATAPCTQVDTGVTKATPGGGLWTKVNVALQPAADQDNFAIWYSYYRTRIALIKSAASLAFSPLNDTKRIGFITMQPKSSVGAAGINPLRFLPVGDFNPGPGGQKDKWFAKLFEQIPAGASPAREGLARVGRYYGGKEDSINTDMPATGANDPIQYTCQQNFAIMTTDGYWNGQTESRGPGLYGGGLQLDGITKVGQQDGDLSDPYSPRPIWDGTSNSIHVVTNKTNAYTDNICSLAGTYRSTFQHQREVSMTTRDYTRTTKRTIQYFQAQSQVYANTIQTTQTVTSDMKTTEQFALHREHFIEEKYQHVRSQEQTTKVTEQWELQTSQALAQTFQTRKVDTKVWKTEEQWQMSSSQSVQTTTQYVLKTDQYKMGRKQVYRHQYQTLAKIGDDEIGVPQAGDCTPIPLVVRCEDRDVLPDGSSRLVDPNTCTTGPGVSVGPGPGYLKTTCIDGPSALAYGPVASCTPGVDPATSLNNWVETRCDYIAGAATPISGTCVVGPPTQDASFFIYTCTRPPVNNQVTPVASCGPDVAGTSPDWITTTCTQPAATNYLPRPSPQCAEGPPVTDGSLITTQCTKSLNNAGYAATCVADPGLTFPFIKVTCLPPEVVADDAVPSASCTPGTVGLITTACPKTAAGTYPSPTPVQTCVNGSSTNAPFFYETTCTYPAATNKTVFTTPALCGTPGVTVPTAAPWITTDCRQPAGANNATVFADPRFCIDDPGTAPPYLKVVCTKVQTSAPIEVPPATCPIGITYNGTPNYYVDICAKRGYSPPTPVAACTPTDPTVPPYIVTTCGTSGTDTPVAFCNVTDPAFWDGSNWVTCVKPAGPNNAGPTQVATCVPDPVPTGPNFVKVTCAGSTTTAAVAVDPATCAAPANSSQQYVSATQIITCYNSPAGAYPVATPVATCANGIDGSLITTVCTFPIPANNHGPIASAPCTVGPPTYDGSQVKTTCTVSDVTIAVPTASCPVNIPQVGTAAEVICSTTTTLGEAAATCSVGVAATTPFDTTTACYPVVTSPMADYGAACVAGPTGVPGESVRCNLRPIDVLVADASCVNSDVAGLKTTCTTSFGNGHKYTVTQTKTVTTTPFSGAAPSGPDAVVTTVTGPTNVDNVCYAAPQSFTAQPPVDIASCGAWPCTEVSTLPGGSENSLADVAQYYYKTDLRPSMTNDPNKGGVPPAGAGPEDDKASHQHMTTFSIALGVSGTLQYRPDYRDLSTVTGDFAAIRAGTKNWPLWPDPLLDYSNPDNYNNPKSIDDFWHAAVNGRGRYFNGKDPSSVIQGVGAALAKIDDKLATGTADGTSTLQPVAGNNFTYSTSYFSGSWQGDVQARLVDLVTGAPGTTIWSAKSLLDARTFAACDDRKILLFRGGTTLVPFTWETQMCPGGTPSGAPVTDLNGAEQALVGAAKVAALTHYPLMTDGSLSTVLQQQEAKKDGKLVNFLRGQRGNENFESNSLTKLFRHREAVLGDIVDSQPVYVGQPFANYQENNYAAFKATARTPMVYVGANDGMLHAFYATVNLLDVKHGQEAWAVIPSAVLGNMYKLADDNYKRDGHQYYVDGTPVAGDVWNGSAWRTIVVGGLNAGGKGYYALDVTTPGATPTPLWEFKQVSGVCPAPAPAAMPTGLYADCNLGLTFGKPIITKLGGNWVVIVTSGYNNANGVSGDGGGYVYVLDALTGELKQKIATGAGDATTPSGLAQINNYVDNVDIDNTTLRAYGGDVLGNIWRFDFSAGTATRLGTAKDASNNIQPITIRPELAELDGKPFVMVGTGKYLGGTDVTDPQKQSVYGIKDPLSGSSPIYADPLRDSLRPMAVGAAAAVTGAVRSITCTGSAAECGRTGWVLDLPEAGERVNVEMKLSLGGLVFTSNVPEAIPCSAGGHSWFNQIDFRTGAAIPGVQSSQFLADSLNVGFNVLELPAPVGGGNPKRIAALRQTDGTSILKDLKPPEPPPGGKRISWREITQ